MAFPRVVPPSPSHAFDRSALARASSSTIRRDTKRRASASFGAITLRRLGETKTTIHAIAIAVRPMLRIVGMLVSKCKLFATCERASGRYWMHHDVGGCERCPRVRVRRSTASRCPFPPRSRPGSRSPRRPTASSTSPITPIRSRPAPTGRFTLDFVPRPTSAPRRLPRRLPAPDRRRRAPPSGSTPSPPRSLNLSASRTTDGEALTILLAGVQRCDQASLRTRPDRPAARSAAPCTRSACMIAMEGLVDLACAQPRRDPGARRSGARTCSDLALQCDLPRSSAHSGLPRGVLHRARRADTGETSKRAAADIVN